MNDTKCIFLNTSQQVWILTLNRPTQNNALNIQAMKEIHDSLIRAHNDASCKAVVLTGTGTYFCNGGELGDYRHQDSMQIREFGRWFITVHKDITEIDKPVIAAVQGHAHGGGLNLVEACDLAVAAEDTTFSVPEIKNGLAPMMALTGLTRVLSRKGVMELSLLGDCISAQQALHLGLINSICKPEAVLETAVKLAGRVAEANPTAVSLVKKLYHDADSLPYDRQLEQGLNMLVSLLQSNQSKEAKDAKEEDRSPIWT